MIKIVENFLKKYDLINPKNTFLVGFSGGADSLSLLFILNKLSKKFGFKLIACHLNHNFRGEVADIEAQNCKQFCASNNIQFIQKKLAKSKNQSEDFARKKRYEFFEKIAEKTNSNILFTAHNFDDNAETLIYRFAKGTGIKGLIGISEFIEKNNLKIYRPLLSVSRKKIEDFCKKNKLTPNFDLSNNDLKYKRNLIRHKILPEFEQINSKTKEALNRLSKLAFEQENILNEYLTLIKKDVFEGEKLITNKFFALSKELQKQIIYNFFIENNLDYDLKKIENVFDFINKNKTSKTGKKCSLTKDLWLFINKDFIYKISKNETIFEKVQINLDKNLIYSNKKFKIEFKPTEKIPNKYPTEKDFKAYINLKNQKNLTLRTRKEGDVIQPFGMKGSMKFKKYLIEKNIPQHKRDNIICLTKDNEILWAIGIGLSEKIKVDKKISHVVKFSNK